MFSLCQLSFSSHVLPPLLGTHAGCPKGQCPRWVTGPRWGLYREERQTGLFSVPRSCRHPVRVLPAQAFVGRDGVLGQLLRRLHLILTSPVQTLGVSCWRRLNPSFLHLLKIVVKYTKQNLSLAIFSMFSVCSHCLCPIPNHFIAAKSNPHPHQLLTPQAPQTLATTKPLFCPCESACSGHVTYTESHPVWPFVSGVSH